MANPLPPLDASRVVGSIPQAWPALLTREQVCAYVGMSADSFANACPVAPVILGVRLLRWRRSDIDAWVEGLPNRLMRGASDLSVEIGGAAPQPFKLAGEERRHSAVENAQRRAARKPDKRKWNKR